jgi:KaiC/GvpD/RAD55 family RecA-like ATPase
MARPDENAPQLPQNIDAERAVLGGIILDDSSLEKVASLTPADFFHDHHRRIFTAMNTMHARQQKIDLVTICEFMGAQQTLALAGGAAYISALIDGVPHISNLANYAIIVKEKSRLRSIITHAQQMQTAAFSPTATAEDLEKLAQLNLSTMQATSPAANGNGRPHLKSYFLDEFLSEKFPIPEHLVEGVIPRGGTVLIVALPHRMKSWFTTSLALACTRAGEALGKLNVIRPVRTLLMQMEDFPGELQYRIGQLALSSQFLECDPKALKIVPRCQFNLPDEEWYQELLREVKELNADVVVLDVVRRIFRGDINSPKDTTAFLEAIDRLRDETGCAVVLVHHENKKGEELMTASAGSYTLPSWANVMIKFSRKVEEKTAAGNITRVELEIDNKLAPSPEPMRMVLDFSQSDPVRMELLEDGTGFGDAMERLGGDWTVRDLAEALDVHKSNAQRRLTKWIKMGKVEKLVGGKNGRRGGLARYHALGSLTSDL